MLDLKLLREKLERPISSQVLLADAHLQNETDRGAILYNDPYYFPAFYYLGQQVRPLTVLELNFELGLQSKCFLSGCDSVRDYFAFQQDSGVHFTDRFARSNIQSMTKAHLHLETGDYQSFLDFVPDNCDLALVNVCDRKIQPYLDSIWSHLSDQGLLTLSYIDWDESDIRQVQEFAEIVNRPVEIFHLRRTLLFFIGN